MTSSRMVLPDDDAARFNAHWLGPDEYTLPIRARYTAWGLWFGLSAVLVPLLIIAAGAAGVLWAQVIAILTTRLTMLAVDSDLPLGSLHTVLRAEARSFSRTRKPQTFRVSLAGLRVRSLGMPTPPPETSP